MAICSESITTPISRTRESGWSTSSTKWMPAGGAITQYRGDQYNPWTEEHLWELPGPNHPTYITPPLEHSIDGPAGFKFNPGTALSPAYKDFFFLTGAPNGNQHAFRVKERGDSFEVLDEHQIGKGIAIVGLAFGPDGGLYGADWDGGYPLDEKGAVIRIDAPGAADSEVRREVRALLSKGLDHFDNSRLLELIAHADQRVRAGAQFTLVGRRAADLLTAAALNPELSELGRLHSLWGLGQLARGGDRLARDTLGLLMRDDNWRLRSQAAKTYGELPTVDGAPLIKLLPDEHPHVRTLAGLALARRPTDKAVPALLEQSEKLSEQDHYWRHSLVMALARCADSEELSKQTDSEHEWTRVCCVLALRRQQSADVAKFLNDPSSRVADEAARAIHDEASIAPALPVLAASLTTRSSQSDAFQRRAVNANYRLGTGEAAARVLEFAQNAAHPVEQRAQALESLAAWLQPEVLDRVEGIYRELDPERREIDTAQLQTGISKLASSSEESLRRGAIAVAQGLSFELPLETLQHLLTSESVDAATRILALESLYRQWNDLLHFAAEAPEEGLRIRALELLSERKSGNSLDRLRTILAEDPSVGARQAAIGLLVEDGSPAALDMLVGLGKSLVEDKLDRHLAIDVLEALEAIGDDHDAAAPLVKELLGASGAEVEQKRRRLALARDGGDAGRGKKLFRTHVQAQCSRCHKVGPSGSEIGPDLTRIAKTRDADYLLRAIVQPSADIDAKYRSQAFLLASGQIVKGVVVEESDEETVIADAAGNLQTIPAEEIEDVAVQNVSLMPDMLDILTAREVRDLVAYLRTLKD